MLAKQFRSTLFKRCFNLLCERKFKSYIIENNEQFIQNVMNNPVPVIVNFHAEWCEPCHLLTPQLKKLLGDSDLIDLAIIDVEKNAELVHTFEVKAVPAVLAVKNGLVIDKFIGLIETDMIENMVFKLLPKDKTKP
uniref:Thioredoxin, mitochondrial n=1 Tax=Cacopsylla melanoneura TaxID=428564 RepID=A0A8D8YFN4_9HEMI